MYRSDELKILRRMINELIDRWYKDVAIGETQFEYLRNSLKRDGKIEGLNELISEMEKITVENYDSSSRRPTINRTVKTRGEN